LLIDTYLLQQTTTAVSLLLKTRRVWLDRKQVDRSEVEAKLAAAETGRREAQSKLEQNAERLAQLEDERNRLLGESADLDGYVEELREQLAVVDEARRALDDAVRARDAALARGAEAAEALLAAIDALTAARTSLNEAHRQLRKVDIETPKALPPEPSLYDEQWRALAPLVEVELGVQLESELVAAAIRNPSPMVLDQLPEHLRELASQQKRDLQRERIRRRRERTEP
jgi:hypothetical protein